MTEVYDFSEGDTARLLEIPIIDENGAAVDLTGKTVTLRWLDKTGALQKKAMTVGNPVSGIATYTWLTDELYAPSMELDIELKNQDATVMYSIYKIPITVREKLG